jgi:hypothetical protein
LIEGLGWPPEVPEDCPLLPLDEDRLVTPDD